MKTFFIVLFALVAIISCKDTERNSPALQGTINDELFRAIDSRAVKQEDGSYIIQGITENEALTLKIRQGFTGVFEVGGESSNYASFEDFNGYAYLTNPNGEGEIVVSDFDTISKIISGTFKFKAILQGIDTIAVQRGVFFEVPFYFEPQDEPNIPNAGTFVAHINEAPFNAFTVTAAQAGNTITIAGTTPSKSIIINVPIDVSEGTHLIPEVGYTASYTEGSTTEEAVSGNISIVSHDPVIRKIKATFSFQTATKNISLGQFNITYQ